MSWGDTKDARGKYLKLVVPDYDPESAQPQTSYLRLGMPEEDIPAVRRDEVLARMVDSFYDDTRHREGCTGRGHNFVPVDDREKETARLLTKGGWRDHSDGNRVTTTQGDKIEVIRGNYKLLVLGRQDAADEGAELDLSGGLIRDGDIAPGGITEIRWVDNYDGTWRVTEESVRGDTIDRYFGDREEHYWGNKITSTTGSADGKRPHLVDDEVVPAGHATQKNPVIVEKTWADTITGHTGSDDHGKSSWVNQIVEKTWAKEIDEEVHAETLKETVHADSITEKTTTQEIDETIDCAGGTITSTTTAAAITEVHVVGAMTESFSGWKNELMLGGQFSFTAGVDIEIFLGLQLGVFLGIGSIEATLAVLKMEVVLALNVEIKAHEEIELNLSDHIRLSTGGGASLTITDSDGTSKTLSKKFSIKSLGIYLG